MGLQDREWFQEARTNRSSATIRSHKPQRLGRLFSFLVVAIGSFVLGMVAADLHWLQMLRQHLPL